MISSKRIIVCSPNQPSGGPELLHQLVHQLKGLGRDAYICYYPFDKRYECPESYAEYDTPQSFLIDDSHTFVIVPETATWIVRDLKKSQAAIWWLSVDNYFLAKRESFMQDLWMSLFSLLKTRLPIFSLKKITHFAQSFYAKNFLCKNGLQAVDLSDCLGATHLCLFDKNSSNKREDIIVYNPRKGVKRMRLLIEHLPHFQFVPLVNMTAEQVRELLGRAKIYVDLGHHPGKDRPPREAAMAGCCVFTNRRGAAAFYEDIPIPDYYKIDDRESDYCDVLGKKIEYVLTNYDRCCSDFDGYRGVIGNEQFVFNSQIRSFFCL